MDTQKWGRPLLKFVVPSRGSTIHRGALFGEHSVVGPGLCDARHDEALAGAVDGRDQVSPPLEAELGRPLEPRELQRAGLLCHLLREGSGRVEIQERSSVSPQERTGDRIARA